MIELNGLEYEDRLIELEYTDLEQRSKRGDLIQLFKIIKGLEEVDIGVNIGRNNARRSHAYQIER